MSLGTHAILSSIHIYIYIYTPSHHTRHPALAIWSAFVHAFSLSRGDKRARTYCVLSETQFNEKCVNDSFTVRIVDKY